MKLAALFSGGKDSTFALFMAKRCGYDIPCLISIISDNPHSYMFHTPSISQVSKQAERMGIPLMVQKTAGEKESELEQLEHAIIQAKEQYHVQGILTGAVESVYQAVRVHRICNRLELECFNPLWQKDQFELLNDLIEHRFSIIITGVAAYPLDRTWLGRTIDSGFIEQVRDLHDNLGLNPAGEGGEFETFVMDCPLFSSQLVMQSSEITGAHHTYRMEVVVK